MKLLLSCIILLCNSLLSSCNEHQDQKGLRIALNIMKHQIEEIMEYQAKQEVRIRELEEDKWNRELEHDLWIRELEQNNRNREQEQNNRIRELERDNQILKQEQDNRIRKLEHGIRIKRKQIEDFKNICILRETDEANFKVNDTLTLSKHNMTALETSGENLKLTAKEAIPEKVTKHLNDRRCGKNGIAGRYTDPSNQIAFYAYMDSHETNPGRHQTLIFDVVKTNVRSAYNKHSGLFISPDHGIYVFTWTIVSDLHGYIYSEIMINSAPFGSILTNSEDITDDHTVTGIVVAEVNQGDVVYIRTNPNVSIKGQILSDTFHRTSFSGWKID
ncbi:C1QL [Mytilus coruscus]|uniref:C1QL n=1 Tax=Mytilus coruscus TaxID=42192 RepID=A0A6J8F3L8_MYTCO|nr:C1QL [Mytilus coruscus]